MATTLKCSKWLVMLAFVITLSMALFGCRFFKKNITRQSRDSTAKSEVLSEIKTRETQHITAYEFGDTLNYNGFIPAGGGTVNTSSKGIAATLCLEPVYDKNNGLLGFQLSNKTLAKPTKTTTQAQNIITDKQQQSKQASSVNGKNYDAHIEKKGMTPTWWAWPLLLLLILIIYQAIRFYKKYVG